jgi:hypothetical protein
MTECLLNKDEIIAAARKALDGVKRAPSSCMGFKTVESTQEERDARRKTYEMAEALRDQTLAFRPEYRMHEQDTNFSGESVATYEMAEALRDLVKAQEGPMVQEPEATELKGEALEKYQRACRVREQVMEARVDFDRSVMKIVTTYYGRFHDGVDKLDVAAFSHNEMTCVIRLKAGGVIVCKMYVYYTEKQEKPVMALLPEQIINDLYRSLTWVDRELGSDLAQNYVKTDFLLVSIPRLTRNASITHVEGAWHLYEKGSSYMLSAIQSQLKTVAEKYARDEEERKKLLEAVDAVEEYPDL